MTIIAYHIIDVHLSGPMIIDLTHIYSFCLTPGISYLTAMHPASFFSSVKPHLCDPFFLTF